ncbi:hypothetical protein SAMN05428995_11511 [Loktanella sp. DSM 29012]|nr:hypothetical protein SAMN05428995_11511 [Loktanella sp. DSM 29012]
MVLIQITGCNLGYLATGVRNLETERLVVGKDDHRRRQNER